MCKCVIVVVVLLTLLSGCRPPASWLPHIVESPRPAEKTDTEEG
jgi:hypothetical protein